MALGEMCRQLEKWENEASTTIEANSRGDIVTTTALVLTDRKSDVVLLEASG